MNWLRQKTRFTEMCSGSEAGSYLRLLDFVYHSTLGLSVIKKKKLRQTNRSKGYGIRLPRISGVT